VLIEGADEIDRWLVAAQAARRGRVDLRDGQHGALPPRARRRITASRNGPGSRAAGIAMAYKFSSTTATDGALGQYPLPSLC